MQTHPVESETLEPGLSPKAALVIALAAKAAGCPLDEFVLQSALSYARETRPDRRHFGLDAERWAAFMAALDAPARELSRVRQLLREPSVFDSANRDDSSLEGRLNNARR